MLINYERRTEKGRISKYVRNDQSEYNHFVYIFISELYVYPLIR